VLKLKTLPEDVVEVPKREPPVEEAVVVELPKSEVPVDAAVFPNRDFVPVVDPEPKTEPVVEAGVPNELLNIAGQRYKGGISLQ
jgi:hypothetical protein